MSNNDQISVDEIRPQDLLAGQKVAIQEDIDFLKSHQNLFVEVVCPACNSTNCMSRFEKNGFKYVTCDECETFYMNPRPSSELLEKFYKFSKNYAYWSNVLFPASEESRKKKIFSPRVDLIIKLCDKYAKNPQSLLEIGAGYGTFCEEMKSRNIFKKIVAIEPTPDLAETCREKGIDVIEQPIEQITFEENDRFDVIVNFEVIEHILSPKEYVAGCRNIVKMGGLVITTCPNGKGFDVITLGTASDTVDHEHLNYFNPQSLGKLFESSGFEIVAVLTPGKLDVELVRNKVLEGKFSVDNNPFLKRVLIDDWDKLGQPFQEFLQKNALSSNMLIIARAV